MMIPSLYLELNMTAREVMTNAAIEVSLASLAETFKEAGVDLPTESIAAILVILGAVRHVNDIDRVL